MARFLFRVVDGSGNVRTGTMEATSIDAARHQAELRGYRVEELRPADPGALTFRAPEPKTGYRSGPARPRSYRGSLWERLAERTPGGPRLVQSLLSVAALGLGWMALGWSSAPPRAHPAAGRAAVQSYVVDMQVKVEGATRPELTLTLPDIPYQQTYAWDALQHPQAGVARLHLEVQTPRPARAVWLRGRTPEGKKASLGPLRVAESTVSFPEVTLRFQTPSLPK